MDLQLLAVPYDSGNHRARMGAGPEALLDAGLERALRENGHGVHTKVAELAGDSWHAEIQTSFELMRMLSGAVREALESGRLPIVLAGNCNTAVGTARRTWHRLHRSRMVRCPRRFQYSRDDGKRISGRDSGCHNHRSLLDAARCNSARVRAGTR